MLYCLVVFEGDSYAPSMFLSTKLESFLSFPQNCMQVGSVNKVPVIYFTRAMGFAWEYNVFLLSEIQLPIRPLSQAGEQLSARTSWVVCSVCSHPCLTANSLQGTYLKEHLTKQLGSKTIKDCQRWKFISHLCGFLSLLGLKGKKKTPSNNLLRTWDPGEPYWCFPLWIWLMPCSGCPCEMTNISLFFISCHILGLHLMSLSVHDSYFYTSHSSRERICGIMTEHCFCIHLSNCLASVDASQEAPCLLNLAYKPFSRMWLLDM